MSSPSADLHGKRLPSETERGQRLPDVDVAQQLKLRERQRFFEEVFQHDVDVYLSSAHLCIRDYKRPPIGSISSMEVNVDLLDQMELIDISDQDALDVFFSSGEEGVLTSPLTGKGNNNNSSGLFRHVLEGLEAKSRTSSASSHSSLDSQTANGGHTPVAGSDDDETHTSTARRRAAPPEREPQPQTQAQTQMQTQMQMQTQSQSQSQTKPQPQLQTQTKPQTQMQMQPSLTAGQ